MSDTKEVVEGELVVIAKESGLAPTKIEGLIAKFGDPFNHARQAIAIAKDIKVTSEDQKDEMEAARVARLELKSIRVDVEKNRKELKEQSLREGKAIDGMANIIKAMIVPVEEELERHEKFAERLAEERKARKIAERTAKLSQYVADVSMYKFEELSDEQFDKLLAEVKSAKEAADEAARKAREAEVAEQQRLEEERVARERAQAEEAERIRKENEKLKAEAVKKEAELAKQREAEEKRLAAERAEQEKKLAEERARVEEERKKREALEAEQKAKEEAEAKAKADAEEAERKALLAPDKQKLIAFADLLDNIEAPNVSNREAGKVLDETKDFLTRISKNLRQKASQL